MGTRNPHVPPCRWVHDGHQHFGEVGKALDRSEKVLCAAIDRLDRIARPKAKTRKARR